jgi:cullin 4
MKKRAGAGGSGGTKKIVIKPFSKPPTLPQNYYETCSQELLSGTLKAVFAPHGAAEKGSTQAISLQNAYQQVVNLVSHQFGPRLYQDLVNAMREVTENYVLPSANPPDSNLLGYVQTQYQQYVEYLLLCKHVFLPLDQSHAWVDGNIVKLTTGDSNSTNNHKASSLWEVGLLQFRNRLQHFQMDDLIYQKWWQSLQQDWEEKLAPDEQSLLQFTLYMWQDLGVLNETLLLRLEPDLIRFFGTNSQRMKNSTEGVYRATAFITYCHSKWMHVALRWSRFLPKSTCITLLEVHLFQPHLNSDWLLKPEHFDPLIEDQAALTSSSLGAISQDQAHIQKLWMLSGRLSGGYKLISAAISNYARTRGNSLMASLQDSKTGKQRISDLLDLQNHLRQVLQQLAHSSEHCSLKPVWEDVVNPAVEGSSNMVAEALAKYVDGYLRDAKKFSPDINWAPRIISGIFCFLQAKDVFEAFYKRDLAKRLLWNRVVSMDAEKHFVSLLKAECGAGYTSKMEGMFQDMEWSRETMTRFKQSVADANLMTDSVGRVDMDIQVLTTGYWPVYPQFSQLILPEALKAPQELFSEHYKQKYQGRRMTWQYALGNCVVQFRPHISGGKYDLVVSLCQALVLNAFNDESELSINKIMARIGLEDRDETERVLQSLCVGKDGTRILLKRDHGADPSVKKKIRTSVEDGDVFTVHDKFKSNNRRIRIPNLFMKETKEEREKTVEAVSRDRLYLIDAVLVRILKARKTILHKDLILQVIDQVKVPAQPADIKKRIESLIEREYMERDAQDRSRYNYLA